MAIDPLRRTSGRTLLSHQGFDLHWTGTHFRVTYGGRLVWSHRVCATDSNAEEVARIWWDLQGHYLAKRQASEMGLL